MSHPMKKLSHHDFYLNDDIFFSGGMISGTAIPKQAASFCRYELLRGKKQTNHYLKN